MSKLSVNRKQRVRAYRLKEEWRKKNNSKEDSESHISIENRYALEKEDQVEDRAI